MSYISEYIEKVNLQGRKVLSVYLTAGFPDPDDFVDLAVSVLDAGADMLELGIPFSDPLADGPVIQNSSFEALQKGITIQKAVKYATEIRKRTDKPLIFMGYTNPILSMGIKNFTDAAKDAGVNGIILPDVPYEEYDDFVTNDFNGLDVTLLTTPTSPEKRIKMIDEKSEGFIYCVSVVGTTGIRKSFDEYSMERIKFTYDTVKKNKMLIGFGIGNGEDVKRFAPMCDGVIVGSAVIKALTEDYEARNKGYTKTLALVKVLSESCKN
jgi:tryptophan synthase alpha chain